MPAWLQEVGKALSALPDEIAKLDKQFHQLVSQIQEKEEALNDREHKLFKEICAELDTATGKAKFSNESLRQGETSLRKKSDEAYVAIATELKALRDKRSDLQVNLTHVNNKFSATKHRATLFASWMQSRA